MKTSLCSKVLSVLVAFLFGAGITYAAVEYSYEAELPACVIVESSPGDNPPVATGLASIMDELVIAYGYKSGEGVAGWTVYNPAWASTHPEWNTITTLYQGRGYWINVTDACNLVYSTRIYGLDEAWNLIGWLGC